MRSFLFIGGLGIVVGLMIWQGYTPRQAGAAGEDSATIGGEIPELDFEYADFDEEKPLVFHRNRSREVVPEEPAEVAPAPPEPTPAGNAAESSDVHEPPVEDSAPPEDFPAPVADAGRKQVVWLGDNEIRLDGSGSTGDGLLYTWRQIDGPNKLTIADPHAAQTTASGFDFEWTPGLDAVYKFELTVTDAHGQSATDTVRCVVRTAPRLRIRPTPREQLVLRDGYMLAQFEAWKTNRTEYVESFQVRSPSALTFHQLQGDAEFEIVETPGTDGHNYEITVFYREGQPSSWLEFFVTDENRIPAVLQFGVNWE